jgi:hypothetical protein
MQEDVHPSDAQLLPVEPPVDYNILFRGTTALVDRGGSACRVKLMHAGKPYPQFRQACSMRSFRP